jgi:hypothetical protein
MDEDNIFSNPELAELWTLLAPLFQDLKLSQQSPSLPLPFLQDVHDSYHVPDTSYPTFPVTSLAPDNVWPLPHPPNQRTFDDVHSAHPFDMAYQNAAGSRVVTTHCSNELRTRTDHPAMASPLHGPVQPPLQFTANNNQHLANAGNAPSALNGPTTVHRYRCRAQCRRRNW